MAEYNAKLDLHIMFNETTIMVKKGKAEMEFDSDIMKRGGQALVWVIKVSSRLTEGREEEDSLQGQKMSLLHSSSPSPPNNVLAAVPILMHYGSE